MTRPSRLLAVAGLAALSSAALAGCQFVEPNIPVASPGAVEACMGAQTWNLDIATLVTSTVGAMAELGQTVTATAKGTQTLSYTPAVGTVTLESDLTITATPAGTEQTETRVLKGTSTGRAFFSQDVAIPRDWNEHALTVTDSFTDKGKPAPTPPPWGIPHTWLDDTVGLVVTCTSDTLTLQPRGTRKSWTFYRVGWTPAPSPTPTPKP